MDSEIPTRKKLSVSRLLLDQRNPRHRHTSSQNEAIGSMIRFEEKEILNIGKHILENGLNPSVTTIVYRNEKGKFIVKDGNRRVTALKCLLNPGIVKDEAVRKKFDKMRAGVDLSSFSKIECVVFTIESEADKWVENNHQGPQDGTGQKPWDSIEKLRDKQNKGKAILELDVLDYMEMNLGSDQTSKIPIDTLRRVVTVDTFKDWTGLQQTSEGLTITIPDSDFNMILARIASDINDGVINTRSLAKINDRKKYVCKLIADFPQMDSIPSTVVMKRSVPDYARKEPSPDSNPSDPIPASGITVDGSPGSSGTQDVGRSGGAPKVVMFESLNWTRLKKSNPKHLSLIEVSNELRDISKNKDYKLYTLSTAFLIRAGYEQCMKLIIETGGQNINKSKNLEAMERQCLGLVARMHSEGFVSNELNDSLKMVSEDDTRKFLNYNVHGPGIIKATSTDLETLASKGMRAFIQQTILDLASIEEYAKSHGPHA